MVVVSDTSPLNYLILIEAVDILSDLYQRVLVPQAVISELQHPDASPMVRRWTEQLPPWIEVHPDVTETEANPQWGSLHRGEQAVLALATVARADLIAMDERLGAGLAQLSGFRVTGTLGVLDEAARQGRIDFAVAIEKLKATSFRYPHALVAELLEEDAGRKLAQG